jgi:hypothetical protein
MKLIKIPFLNTTVLLCMLLFLAVSCEKDQSDEIFSYTEFSLADKNLLIDYDAIDEDMVIVINSLQELQKYIDGTADIDFTKHSLLLATGLVLFDATGIAGSIEQLSANEYRLNATLTTRQFHPTDPYTWAIAFVTSKVSNKIAVELETTLNNPDLECSPIISYADETCLSLFDIVDVGFDYTIRIIIGKWKLIKILNRHSNQCFDYTHCNIVLEFSEDQNLTISKKTGQFLLDKCWWGGGSDGRSNRFIQLRPVPPDRWYSYQFRVNSNELCIYARDILSENPNADPAYLGYSYYLVRTD